MVWPPGGGEAGRRVEAGPGLSAISIVRLLCPVWAPLHWTLRQLDLWTPVSFQM